jgi:subtilisin family serine protease
MSLAIAAVWFIGWSVKPSLAMSVNGGEEKKSHSKMESILEILAAKYSKDRVMAREFADRRKIPFRDEEVTVILVPPPGMSASAIDEGSLSLYGAKVEAVSRHLIRVRIPISKLVEIAENVAGISYIRLPHTPLPGSVTSEGVSLTNAVEYHSSGYEGQSTKVAIIDVGFFGLAMVLNAAELPSDVITKDFTGTGLTTGLWHGTEVAEIVYDMAPQAQLYLIKVADEVDLENAKDYSITEDVNIINHSWGWPNTNFTDGTGLVCDIANDARSQGVLWVNAAGNAAKMHYQDHFTDTDGDGWHEFSPGDETNDIQANEGSDIIVFLTWDAWPTTDKDYDLYLYDSSFNLVASSTNAQTGTQPPTEKIVYRPLAAGTYYVMVKESSASGNQELKILTYNYDLEYPTSARSIWPPADAEGVVSVTAINQADWETGPQESYSSQGPTNDGRIKPDISGPDGVSIYTNGVNLHYGTSFASPHVAGAASLLLSKYPHLTAAELQPTLESWAIDMGSPGKDNIYGSGRLNLFVSDAPVLSWTGEANYVSDGLNPEKGTTSTEFVYRIEYTHKNNLPPKDGYPKVHILKGNLEIASSPFSMVEVDTTDTTYTDGKLYAYTRTLSRTGKDYSYYFEAKDVYEAQAIGIPITELRGPDKVLAANLESLIVYPNPFQPVRGHTGVVFAGLTTDATIRIFDLSGQEISRGDISWEMSWTWNVTNSEGERVTRGIYIYLVTNSQGEKEIGKIAVVK